MTSNNSRMEHNNEGMTHNPFDAAEAPGVSLVVQLRIYDVLLAILTDMNPEKAKQLMELHAGGDLMAFSPSFSGTFIADNISRE